MRVVPIAPGLFPIRRDYMLARSSLNPRDFLLTQKDGTPWRRKAVERRTARWGTAAQVPECVPHRFRHLFRDGPPPAGDGHSLHPGTPRAREARHDGDLHAGRESGARESDQAATDYRPGFWATSQCGQLGGAQAMENKEKRQRRPLSP